jgi:hypothetical protein
MSVPTAAGISAFLTDLEPVAALEFLLAFAHLLTLE